MPLTLAVSRVTTLTDVEELRRLRNAASGSFSHFNDHISEEEQRRWWAAMSAHVEAWLYSNVQSAVSVGYGLVREEDGRWWNSIGVHPHYRRQGVGSFITHDVLTRHDGPIYATVRRDNIAGLAMHHAADWEPVDGPDMGQFVYLRSRVSRSD